MKTRSKRINRLSKKSFKVRNVVSDKHSTSRRTARHTQDLPINVVRCNYSYLGKGSFLTICPEIRTILACLAKRS